MNVERLDDYSFDNRGKKRGSKWDPYLDGGIYRVSASEVGLNGIPTLRSSLAQAAARRNKRIQSRVENDDTLVFRAHARDAT